MADDQTDAEVRFIRIARMIEEFRAAKQRRIRRRAIKRWRRTEAERLLALFEAPPERVH